MPLSLDCTLLCASGAAYDIKGKTYTPDPIYSKAVDYATSPAPVAITTGTDDINACLIGQTSIGIIVSFRGTLPTSWLDWFQDILIEPVSSPGLPGKVHDGFQSAVQSMYQQLVTALNGFKPSPTNPIFVTGHSKGGGMAPLAAYLLAKQDYPVKQVITFAAPKSGDGAFATGYNAVIRNHVRYENYGDLVPLLPPADVFISVLAAAVSWIPDIGPQLAKLLNEAAGWGYTPVGTKLFIDYDYSIVTHESDYDQVGDFIWNLATNLGSWDKALGNAHTLACNYGYMRGTCPSSVCSQNS